MPSFRRLSEPELFEMNLAGLLAHVRAARAAGDAEQELLAQQMAAYKELSLITARVRLRCRRAPDWAIEEIAGNALESTVRQQWRGETEASFRAWRNAIINGEIATFFRTKKGMAVLAEVSLDTDEDDERSGHEQLGGGRGNDDALLEGLERSLQLDVADALLSELETRNPMHARVVQRALWDERPSREVAEECDTSPANVDQIKARFRTALTERLVRDGWSDT